MKSLLFLCFLGVGVQNSVAVSPFEAVVEEWEAWKAKYNKNYELGHGKFGGVISSQEEDFRMKIWLENKAKIERHNQLHYKGEVKYFLRLNKNSDRLTHELQATRKGFKRSPNRPRGTKFRPPANVNLRDLPDSFDWRDEGAVTEVKDQGYCGCCWAFGAVGALESANFINTGELTELSEQQLVDCSTGWSEHGYSNYGCEGGDQAAAFDYIRDNEGIDTEGSYPYLAEDGTCTFNKADVGADDVGFTYLDSGDEDDLKTMVATKGPVAVSMNCMDDMFDYGGGIYDNSDCDPNVLDHVVLLVGYGVDEDSGDEFWIVKNSWGADWGEAGYFRMARNKGDMCGLATDASFPLWTPNP